MRIIRFNTFIYILQIENHSMIIIASDSYSLQPQTANTLLSTGGERYDFILNADQKPGKSTKQTIISFNFCKFLND